MSVDKVAANYFYQDDGDKIKLNWFLYEYANVMFSTIEEDRGLAAYRKKHGRENIVFFCVYFSKRMRLSITNLQRNLATALVMEASYVHEFYPNNTAAQIQKLLKAATAAWEEQARACRNCPNQCVYDGFERTDMFDNLEQTGWPTP